MWRQFTISSWTPQQCDHGDQLSWCVGLAHAVCTQHALGTDDSCVPEKEILLWINTTTLSVFESVRWRWVHVRVGREAFLVRPQY